MFRLAVVASFAIAVAFLPVSINPTSSQVIVVNEACAQATSCKKMVGYICSTYIKDQIDYVCYTGCAEVD